MINCEQLTLPSLPKEMQKTEFVSYDGRRAVVTEYVHRRQIPIEQSGDMLYFSPNGLISVMFVATGDIEVETYRGDGDAAGETTTTHTVPGDIMVLLHDTGYWVAANAFWYGQDGWKGCLRVCTTVENIPTLVWPFLDDIQKPPEGTVFNFVSADSELF